MAGSSEPDKTDDYGDYVSLKTLSGASLSVPIDHYHGIWTDRNHIKCLVCGVKVEDANEHMQEQHHKLMVAAAVDGQGIRALSEKLNHCILCNEIIDQRSKNDHERSLYHNFKMWSGLVTKIKHKRDIGNLSFEDSVTSDEHETLMDNLTKTFEEISLCQPVTFIEKPKQTHYLMEERDYTEFCVVCKVKVPRNIHNIQEHIDGKTHLKLYNYLLNSNKVERIRSGGFYCEICKVTVGKTLEIDHIDSSSHIKKRRTHDPKKTHYLTEVRDHTEFCKVCKVKVNRNMRNIQEHIDGKNHCKIYKFLLKLNKVERIRKGRFYCKICEVTVGKTLEIDHIDSSTHIKNRCTKVK